MTNSDYPEINQGHLNGANGRSFHPTFARPAEGPDEEEAGGMEAGVQPAQREETPEEREARIDELRVKALQKPWRRRRSRRHLHVELPTSVVATLTLAAGLAVGAFATRAHYKSPDVIAAVNGTAIDRHTLDTRLEILQGPSVLHQIISEEMQTQFVRQKRAGPSKADLDARYLETSKRPNFRPYLAQLGETPDQFRQTLWADMGMANIVSQGVRITDSEVKQFYDRNVDPNNPGALYYTPQTVTVSVIVTSSHADILKAYSSLAQGGSFRTAALTYSQDSSKSSGGDLPPLVRGRTASTQLPDLQQRIYSMKIGGQIGPLQADNLWWIIRCTDNRPPLKESFDSVKLECQAAALQEKAVAQNAFKVNTEFDQFQRDSAIQSFDPQFAGAVRF